MKVDLKDNVLVIYVEGRITANNASTLESDIKKALDSNTYQALVIDCGDLVYISSAGLRVILSLGKEAKDFKVVNVNTEVYDIFEMTGFTEILKIEKGLRSISVKNATVIGDGFNGTVYRLNKDTIVKVFKNTHDVNEVRRELNMAKQAFVLGIPTCISFDVVNVEDKIGVVFEMLDCDSLKDLIVKNPNKLDDYIVQYADLLKKINTTDASKTDLPKLTDIIKNKLKLIKPHADKDVYGKIEKLVLGIKDTGTLVHGDYHVKNVMVQNDEFLLIDMDTLCVGNPIQELAAFYCTYIAFEEFQPGNNLSFLGLDKDTTNKLFYDTVKIYFKGLNEQDYNDNLLKIEVYACFHMMYWTVFFENLNQKRFDYFQNKLKELLPKVKDLNIKLK